MPYAQARVFRPWSLGSLTLRNRVVMAPMTRRQAGPGAVVTEASAAYYARRARGGVGLIISEGTPVDELHAFDAENVPRLVTSDQIAGWRRVVEAVHEAGSAFAPQLWHTGRFAANPIAPSALPASNGRPEVRAMTAVDLEQVRDAFVHAARATVAIGADALELHGAHGYLLHSFLDPAVNRREDRYGGSPEARRRFPVEVVAAVREAVGEAFPIIYRFSQWTVDDFERSVFASPDELAAFVVALEEAGVTILHASTRRFAEPAFPEQDPERGLAAWARDASGLPVIAVGGVSLERPYDREGEDLHATADPGPAFELVERGEVDLLALGRALIANPDWVKVVRDGDWRKLVPFDKAQLATLE